MSIKFEPDLNLNRWITGSSFGRVGFRIIKGKKVWFKQNKRGHWRKMSEYQSEYMILNNPHSLFQFR